MKGMQKYLHFFAFPKYLSNIMLAIISSSHTSFTHWGILSLVIDGNYNANIAVGKW
jgi:hypothetical protein